MGKDKAFTPGRQRARYAEPRFTGLLVVWLEPSERLKPDSEKARKRASRRVVRIGHPPSRACPYPCLSGRNGMPGKRRTVQQ